MSDEFSDKRDKIQPESLYDYPVEKRRRKRKITFTLAITVTILIPLSLVTFWVGRNTAPQNPPVTVITEQPTPKITAAPVPTQVTPVVTTLNSQLVCQHCEEPNVLAFMKSYSTDPLGYTSFTLLFTNHTSNAVNVKVDTIKMIDQSGNSIPLHASDPYVPVATGQTTPMSVVLQFLPQQGSKYTFSIVVEEANVFANFYQSTPLTLSQ